MALAIKVADRAARELARRYLAPLKSAPGWYQSRLPPGLQPDEAGAVRGALRYLHRRGLVWDHPQRSWIALSRPVTFDAPRRYRVVGR